MFSHILPKSPRKVNGTCSVFRAEARTAYNLQYRHNAKYFMRNVATKALLDTWNRRKESKERMILLGGMLHDLECYVDN